MEFEWDVEKSNRNLRERGFDFSYATRVFAGWTRERPDTRKDYGELRLIATGLIDGQVFTVVYTDRAGNRRVISARRSGQRERKAFWQAYQEAYREGPTTASGQGEPGDAGRPD